MPFLEKRLQTLKLKNTQDKVKLLYWNSRALTDSAGSLSSRALTIAYSLEFAEPGSNSQEPLYDGPQIGQVNDADHPFDPGSKASVFIHHCKTR